MKMLRTISMMIAAIMTMASISSCQGNLDLEDASNDQILHRMNQLNLTSSLHDDIEFMILTPKGLAEVGLKDFVLSTGPDLNYPELENGSFFAVTSSGRYADEIVSIMAHTQNIEKCKPGDKLDLKKVSFGCMLSNDSANFIEAIDKGKVVLKSINSTSVTLRFVKVKGSLKFGDYYFNGDITFDISE